MQQNVRAVPAHEDWKPNIKFRNSVVYNELNAWPRADVFVPFSGPTSPLSNFWHCSLEYRDQLYYSSEHAYQAMKALCAGSPENARAIRAADTAARAKHIARFVSLDDQQRQEWETLKVGVMKDILTTKYQQCMEFRDALQGGCVYVETTRDKFWGAGVTKDEFRSRGMNFEGKNVLGALLTQLAHEGHLEKVLWPALPQKDM